MKIQAILLYMAGSSYRNITYVLKIIPCSNETVRLWVKKLEHITINIEAKPRKIVAIDETKIKANGKCAIYGLQLM